MTGSELARQIRQELARPAGHPGDRLCRIADGEDPGLPRLSKPYLQEELAAQIAKVMAPPDQCHSFGCSTSRLMGVQPARERRTGIMAVRLRPVGGAGLCRLPETRHGPHCDAGRIAHACETAPTRNHKGADAGGDGDLPSPSQCGQAMTNGTAMASPLCRRPGDPAGGRRPKGKRAYGAAHVAGKNGLRTRKCEFGFWRRGLTSHYIRAAHLCAEARPSRGCPARRCRDDRPASEAHDAGDGRRLRKAGGTRYGPGAIGSATRGGRELTSNSGDPRHSPQLVGLTGFGPAGMGHGVSAQARERAAMVRARADDRNRRTERRCFLFAKALSRPRAAAVNFSATPILRCA